MSADTQSLHLFLGRPLGALPSTSICLTAFGHTSLGWRSKCPYQRSLPVRIMLSRSLIPSILCISDILTRSTIFLLHIHLTIALSAVTNLALSVTVMGQVSLAWSITRRTHALKMPPLWSGDIAELVRIGRSSLKLFQAHLIRTVIASWQPPALPIVSPR